MPMKLGQSWRLVVVLTIITVVKTKVVKSKTVFLMITVVAITYKVAVFI